jgi:dTMP kinase
MTFLCTFEGLDCSGKTTCLNFMQDLLAEAKVNAYTTREPGGTQFGEDIRTLIKTKSEGIEPLTEILLFYASRIEVLHKIVPNYQVVLCDRFYDSTFAYQGALDNSITPKIQAIHDICIGKFKPNLTLLFDVTPEIYQYRRSLRGLENCKIEARSNDYFMRVRDIYLERASNEPNRFKIIDATQDLDQVLLDVQNITQEIINQFIG